MIFAPEAGEVASWYVAFHAHCRNRWVRRLVPGRFKHVSLIGSVPAMRAWVWLEVHFGGTRVAIYPDTEAGRQAIADRLGDHALLVMPPVREDGGGFGGRVGLTCVSMAAHTLGLPGGALLPDGLWRKCLAHGARIVFDHGISDTESQARSRVGSAESG